jgi:hypothetical protein
MRRVPDKRKGSERVARARARAPNTQNGIFAELKHQCALVVSAFDASPFFSNQHTFDASNYHMRLVRPIILILVVCAF